MAPSAVSTTATEQVQSAPTYKLNLGLYKEIDPYHVDHDIETGKVGGNGAKVRQNNSERNTRPDFIELTFWP